MGATTKLVVGFLALILSVLFAYWFCHNYFRIGPEVLEPFVFFGGWALALGVASVGLVLLVKGAKGV